MTRKTGYITDNLDFVSTGLCPNCIECMELWGYEDMDVFNEGIENGDIFDEGSFSHYPCDDCNTNLGGDSFIAHGVDKESEEIIHFHVCYDCFFELNGYPIEE